MATLKVNLSKSKPEILGEGASLRRAKSTIPFSNIAIFEFDPKKFLFSIAIAPNSIGQTARQFRKDQSAIFAIVASVFHRDNQGNVGPAGLLTRSGISLSKLNAEWSTGGVLVFSRNAVRIIPIQEFDERQLAADDHAIQSHLFVVDPGRRNGIRGRTPELASRTAICILDNGNISFVILNGLIDLFDFAEILSATVERGGIGCERAMYLDGGPSTQASFSMKGQAIEIEGEWVIPSAITVHQIK